MTEPNQLRFNDYIKFVDTRCGDEVGGTIVEVREKAILVSLEATKKSNSSGWYRDEWMPLSQLSIIDSISTDPKNQDAQVIYTATIPTWLFLKIRKVARGY